ncbi:MAG: FAD binding domain-containing protein, partial [Oscillospiraceae bacterium]|nr:FAD binding domain-containing protein [Oscillospiraceae bacterium]
ETGAGEKRTCIAAHQSDAAPVLTALRAKLKTTERLIDAADFFSVGVLSSTALEAGEILTEIQIPVSEMSMSCRYKRFAFRKSIDFPVLSVTVAKDGGKNYAVALGGAAPVPYRAAKAEELLKGSDNTPETAAAAGEAAIAGAKPYSANAYKLQIIKTLVKRELMAMSQTAANQSF